MATAPMTQPDLLAAARSGDETAFERLVDPHRRELHAHCYRMLASVHDAEDALQEALLGAWRGVGRFEGRSSLRTWLYTIATNACLRLLERRPQIVLPIDYGPPADPHDPIAEPLDARWLEPYPDAGLGYEQRESVELAFIAALQHLPPRQRAVLILRDVLGFSGAEVAEALETTPGLRLQRAPARAPHRRGAAPGAEPAGHAARARRRAAARARRRLRRGVGARRRRRGRRDAHRGRHADDAAAPDVVRRTGGRRGVPPPPPARPGPALARRADERQRPGRGHEARLGRRARALRAARPQRPDAARREDRRDHRVPGTVTPDAAWPPPARRRPPRARRSPSARRW